MSLSPFLILKRRKKFQKEIVLDIGTEAVKGMIFQKNNSEVSILAQAIEYYDRYTVFLTSFFEKEIMKRTILKVIEKLKSQTSFQFDSVILNLPPDVFIAKVARINYKTKEERITKEKGEKIFQEVEREAIKRIGESNFKERGVLPHHLQFLKIKILEKRINGYVVPEILNYEGEDLEFKVLGIFLPREYLNSFFSPVLILKEMKVRRFIISHLVEGLINLIPNPLNLEEAVFLDIGGKITQIFLLEDKSLKEIAEVNLGGKEMSQIFSEILGLGEDEARVLKERYSKGELSESSRKVIKEFLEKAVKIWCNKLKEKLLEINFGVFPEKIFIFGGGALLPEIKEKLEREGAQVSFFQFPKFKVSSQFLPCLLSYYGAKNF